MTSNPWSVRTVRAASLALAAVLAATAAHGQDVVRTAPGSPAPEQLLPATAPGSAARQTPDGDLSNSRAWKEVFDNVVRDQKDVLRFPQSMQGHWVPFVALAAATAGLVAVDPAVAPKFRASGAFRGFNGVASGLNTSLAMAAVPAAFYLARSKAHDSYGKETVLLAAEAVADVQIMTFAAKMIDRRLRPSDVPPGGDYDDTWFRASALDGKSFPSGHTITAFALAEVFVKRYPEHRWVPWVAYGLAATVGFSRLTLQAHFPSDVFAGGALGIAMTDGLVLRRPH